MGLRSEQFGFDGPAAVLFCGARVVLEDVVHLFQRATLGLGDEEECPDKGEEAEYGEEGVCAEAGVLD